jgi:methionyl aminopeptidase
MITLKSPEQIEILRQGGHILAEILHALETLVVVGNSTQDVEDAAQELMEQYGVEPLILGYKPRFAPRPYPAATCVSVNHVLVHGIPNEDPVVFETGDVVSIDAVIGYQGMVVDSARTVGVGELSKEAKQLIHVTKMALDAGIKAAQPGAHIRDIGKAIEGVVPKGFSIVEAFCGHGVGFDLHEEPIVPNFVMKGESPELVPGMVIAIEPMITLGSKDVVILEDGYTAVTADGSLAAHVEHTVAITEDGPVILTT